MRGFHNVSHGALPTLDAYFSAKNRLPRSDRYILGPVGLAADAPEIPAHAALFDFGTEAELVRYQTPAGPVSLIVFSFATPSLARQQLPEFQKIAGACHQAHRAASSRLCWDLRPLPKPRRNSLKTLIIKAWLPQTNRRCKAARTEA